MSGNVLVAILREATGLRWVEARDAAKHTSTGHPPLQQRTIQPQSQKWPSGKTLVWCAISQSLAMESLLNHQGQSALKSFF